MMDILKIIITIIFAIDCIALVVVVLLQEGKGSGISALAGGSENFWSQNKGRSMEGALSKVTKILAALFLVLALVLNLGIFNV